MKKIGPLIFWLGLLGLWQGLSYLSIYPKAIIPPPLTIVLAMDRDFLLISKHLGSTLWNTVQGLFWGVLSGLITAVFVDKYPKTQPYLWPFLTLSQTLPPFLIYPLLLLTLGFGQSPRILIAALVCFFPIAVSFSQGLKETDKDRSELFKSLGAGTLSTYLYLRIPSALPGLLSGLKLAAAYGVVGVVYGEMMGGPMEGIGFYMIRKLDSFQPASVYAAVLIISLITFTIIKFLELGENLLFSHRKNIEP